MTVLALIQTRLMIKNDILSKIWNEDSFVKSCYFSQMIPRIFFVDALFKVASSLFGLSATTLFVESFIAYAFGAVTGLASVVCGLLFQNLSCSRVMGILLICPRFELSYIHQVKVVYVRELRFAPIFVYVFL